MDSKKGKEKNKGKEIKYKHSEGNKSNSSKTNRSNNIKLN